LPPGLSISSTMGLISGTLNLIGDYTVTVEVSDPVSTTSVIFGWTVTGQGGEIYLPMVVRNHTATLDSRNVLDGDRFWRRPRWRGPVP
jgi:hypothetical protein